MSTDELTGVQALERKHPGLPLAPGKVERREFEYIRHGTRSFIISRDVVTGQIVEPYGGPRRTEADFLQHVEAVIASDRAAQRWHFVVDNLDTHRSESLVRWVARESGLDLELGKKGKWGTLANRESRAIEGYLPLGPSGIWKVIRSVNRCRVPTAVRGIFQRSDDHSIGNSPGPFGAKRKTSKN